MTSGSARVVVTGFGCLSAAGRDLNSTWESILQGASGIQPIAEWDASEWTHPLIGEIKDYKPRDLVPDRKLLKVITRMDVLGLNAVVQAVEHSGILPYRESLSDPTSFNDRTGVFVGSPGTKYEQQYDYLRVFSNIDEISEFGSTAMQQVHPLWLLRTLPNNVLAYTGIEYGFKGSNQNITGHGVSGSLAIGEACRNLVDGVIDRAIVAAYDSPAEPEAIAYYASAGLLSPTGIRSFDATRDGTVLGEGAGAMVLESLESAQERGATIYGEILGSSVVSEAVGILSIRRDGEGLRRAIQLALEDAGKIPDEVGMIAAHGNGGELSDASEALVITEVFGPTSVPVTGFKWSLAHTISASGTIECILALKSLSENHVPGIASLNEVANDCQTLNVSREAAEPRSPVGLVVTRGFAGLQSCLVVSTEVN